MLGTFIISYLLVLLLPVGIILAYYYPNSTKVVNEKEVAWNGHVTEQFMNSMDIFTRYVYNLPFELTQNREIKLYMAKEDDYQRYIIANEMRKYNATDAFVDNTLLYVKSIGYLFAKTGSAYTVADFARPGIGYYYEHWPHDRMFAQLDSLAAPTVRPVEEVIVPGNNRARVMTFLLPLPLGGRNAPGVVLILVKEQTIVSMMRAVSDSYTGDFFIFDERGRRLVASSETAYSESGAFEAAVRRLMEDGARPGIERLNGKSYIVTHTVSDKNGWHFVSLLPVTQAQQDIRAIQRNSIALGSLLLLLEFLVISVSIRRNYRPIKRLVDFSAGIFAPPHPRKLGEIDTIRYALGRLFSDNSKLDERVKRTLPIMRDNLLFGLVSGHYRTWDDFRREPGAYGLHFDCPFVTIAILSRDSGDDGVEEALEVCRAAESGMPDGLAAYFFKSIYRDEIVAVCSHAQNFPLKRQLDDLRQMLIRQTGVSLRIGIGKPESSRTPEGVQFSYLQAMRTAEHLQIRKQPPVLVFDEIDIPPSGAVSYSAELLQALELSILKNDVPAIESAMARIVAYIGNDGMPPHMVRTIYLNTISVIVNGFQRFRHNDRTLLQLSDAAFHHRYTIEQMVGIMKESGGKLCAVIGDTLPAARPVSIARILSLIGEKGMDPDFSLQMIADHFGMSMSNFSYYFKKNMGCNYKEYIDRLRIQRSMHLLKGTTEPLDAISQQVGYASTSSFIRCFKKIAGTTPGQYREASK